jgi:hypothetical protein
MLRSASGLPYRKAQRTCRTLCVSRIRLFTQQNIAGETAWHGLSFRNRLRLDPKQGVSSFPFMAGQPLLADRLEYIETGLGGSLAQAAFSQGTKGRLTG